ncbi:hypothetical protein Tco_0882428 [Tanacetum coccineum]
MRGETLIRTVQINTSRNFLSWTMDLDFEFSILDVVLRLLHRYLSKLIGFFRIICSESLSLWWVLGLPLLVNPTVIHLHCEIVVVGRLRIVSVIKGALDKKRDVMLLVGLSGLLGRDSRRSPRFGLSASLIELGFKVLELKLDE